MDVWVEGSDKRRPTNGPVLKSFYDNKTDQWVGPNDKNGMAEQMMHTVSMPLATLVQTSLELYQSSIGPGR